jgi:hypothetical protein
LAAVTSEPTYSAQVRPVTLSNVHDQPPCGLLTPVAAVKPARLAGSVQSVVPSKQIAVKSNPPTQGTVSLDPSG